MSPTPTGSPTDSSTDSPIETETPKPLNQEIIPEFEDRDFNIFEKSDEDVLRLNLSYESTVSEHQGLFDELAQGTSWDRWLNSIPNENEFTETKDFQYFFYPEKGNGKEYDRFLFDKFARSEDCMEAMDWIRPYNFAWMFRQIEGMNFKQKVNESSHMLAPTVERSVNDFTENEIFVFPTYIHDEVGEYESVPRDDDGLFPMMTVLNRGGKETYLATSNPYIPFPEEQATLLNIMKGRERTDDGIWANEVYNPGNIIHPRAENSVLLPSYGKEDFDVQKEKAKRKADVPEEERDYRIELELDDTKAANSFWHPLRFNGSKPDVSELNYTEAKALVSEMLRDVTHNELERRDTSERGTNSGVAPTARYLESVTDGILNLAGRDQINFDQLIANSIVYNELCDREGRYVVGGTAKNPRYVMLDESNYNVAERVWNDQNNGFDDIGELLES